MAFNKEAVYEIQEYDVIPICNCVGYDPHP